MSLTIPDIDLSTNKKLSILNTDNKTNTNNSPKIDLIKSLATNYVSSKVDYSKIHMPKYARDVVNCPSINLGKLFDTSKLPKFNIDLPKFNIDLPDWKIRNFFGLEKIGKFFSSLDLPSLPKIKLSSLQLNGLSGLIRCLGINELNPLGKNLKFKQELSNLNNIDCNNSNMFTGKNNLINYNLYKSIFSAHNCNKPANNVTKESISDLKTLIADKTLDSVTKNTLIKAVVKSTVYKKFSIDTAKNTITDPNIKNLFKSALNEINHPGSKMHVSRTYQTSSLEKRESIVNYATTLTSAIKIVGNNVVTKLAKGVSIDSAQNANIKAPVQTLSNSQKITIISKIKEQNTTNNFNPVTN